MIVLTLLAAWAAMLAAPETRIGRALRQALVIAPAIWIDRITRGHILLAVAVMVVAGLVFWSGEADGVSMLGLATPELTAWIVTFDVATYLDVVVTLAMAASTLRARAIGARFIKRPVARIGRAGRARRTRRPERPKADNDGEPHRWALAA